MKYHLWDSFFATILKCYKFGERNLPKTRFDFTFIKIESHFNLITHLKSMQATAAEKLVHVQQSKIHLSIVINAYYPDNLHDAICHLHKWSILKR